MSSSHERTTNELIRTNDATLTRTNDVTLTRTNDVTLTRTNDVTLKRTNDVTLTRTNDDRTHPNEERTDELQKSKTINKKNKKSCWQLVWEEKKVNKRKGKNQTCCRSLIWAFCCALFSFPFSTSDLSLLIMSKRFSCFSCITCLL